MSEDMMFDLTIVHFQEINNNPEYFENNKDGLKTKVIWISPYDYIKAVTLRKEHHTTSESKLKNLKLLYEQGIKVPMPYLIYGDRDEHSNHFGQEGFNRAYSAICINKESIPVAVRYREEDENIPSFIKKHLLSTYVQFDIQVENLKNSCKEKNIKFIDLDEYSQKVENKLAKDEIESKYIKYLELSVSQSAKIKSCGKDYQDREIGILEPK